MTLPRMGHALIAAASLVGSGCASQGYQGYDQVSVTYQYTDENRVAAEQRAIQSAQDECYLRGDTYAQPAGPPQIVNDGGPKDGRFRATQSFYCIGMRGEG